MKSMIAKIKSPAGILGVLAVGALLLTATALPFGSAYADDPSRPLVIEEAVIDMDQELGSSDTEVRTTRSRDLVVPSSIDFTAQPYLLFEEYEWGDLVEAPSNAAVKTDTVPVFDFQDHGGVIVMNPQVRGTSDLVRTVDGISMNIETTDLPVGAYTVWWVIFNDPSMCSDGSCGENDVLPPPGTPEAGVSPLWATGGVVGPDRTGHFSARLGVGLESAQGQVLWGEGLTDPMGAEVHLVVRYHGPVTWSNAGTFLGQLTTFQGYCTPESSFDMGTDSGAFACYEPQATMHLP